MYLQLSFVFPVEIPEKSQKKRGRPQKKTLREARTKSIGPPGANKNKKSEDICDEGIIMNI